MQEYGTLQMECPRNQFYHVRTIAMRDGVD